MILKDIRRRIGFDAEKYSFGNLICNEWNELSGWIVFAETGPI